MFSISPAAQGDGCKNSCSVEPDQELVSITQLACADCLQLPFRAAVFDLAVCSFALSHIQDLRQMARELARVMKPNAIVFVSDLHPEAHARGWGTGFPGGRGACQIETVPAAAE